MEEFPIFVICSVLLYYCIILSIVFLKGKNKLRLRKEK